MEVFEYHPKESGDRTHEGVSARDCYKWGEGVFHEDEADPVIKKHFEQGDESCSWHCAKNARRLMKQDSMTDLIRGRGSHKCQR